jgi:hypothetical protein
MSIQTKKVDGIEFLLDKRPIKIKSELSFDDIEYGLMESQIMVDKFYLVMPPH